MEKRRLTPREMRAISLEAREDYQAAVEEVRKVSRQLDEHSRLKAKEAVATLPPSSSGATSASAPRK